ncbi:SCO family protein [Prolixibacteraceae bacterium JC049]|nr:SCO family protein [Prolixibacteraceae bacterium JC049]
MLKLKSLILTLGLILALSPISRADDQSNDPEIGIVEHLNEFLPKEVWVTNEAGKKVNLIDEIDKPTIINMVYFRCPGVCSPLMDGIADVIDKSDMDLGKDFQVLTISFDPSEGIDLAKNKKANYLAQMNKKISAEKGWKFYVSDSTSIARITNAIGFKYKKAGNDFLHAASIVFVNKDKMICRYLNGTYFLPIELKMSVIEANKGNSMPTVNRVLQFCYSYDPVGQAYVLNVTKISATLILALAVIVFLFLIFKPRRKKD